MTIERTHDGLEVRLKSHGAGRYVSGAFLAFWLCGWAVGEAVVLWILIKGAIALLTGTPPDPGREPLQVGPAAMVGLFLIVWLSLWTIGGIAAISELLRLIWGEDRIAVSSGRLRVTWIRGPFRSERAFERDEIRRVSLLGRQEHLALETSRQRQELSGLGSRAERSEGATAIRSALGMTEEIEASAATLPARWEEVITPEGERALAPNLSTRRAQARFASVATLVFAAVTFLVARESLHGIEVIVPAFVLLVITAGLAAGTLWLARGRMEWRIGSGRLSLRKRYGGSVKDVFEGRRLQLDSHSDSDGDVWYDLSVLGEADVVTAPARVQWRPASPKHSRSVARLMNDAATVHDLAAWLSSQTGIALEDRTRPEARAAELAELRAALENSGRFGQWAAKLVVRLGEERKRAG